MTIRCPIQRIPRQHQRRRTAQRPDPGLPVRALRISSGDCIVTHLLANDDGPIDYVVAPVIAIASPAERAVELLAAAGLLDDPPVFVPYEEFEGAEPAGVRP